MRLEERAAISAKGAVSVSSERWVCRGAWAGGAAVWEGAGIVLSWFCRSGIGVSGARGGVSDAAGPPVTVVEAHALGLFDLSDLRVVHDDLHDAVAQRADMLAHEVEPVAIGG